MHLQRFVRATKVPQRVDDENEEERCRLETEKTKDFRMEKKEDSQGQDVLWSGNPECCELAACSNRNTLTGAYSKVVCLKKSMFV